jgi:hypothetical protein
VAGNAAGGRADQQIRILAKVLPGDDPPPQGENNRGFRARGPEFGFARLQADHQGSDRSEQVAVLILPFGIDALG